jgi:hypothetical protein
VNTKSKSRGIYRRNGKTRQAGHYNYTVARAKIVELMYNLKNQYSKLQLLFPTIVKDVLRERDGLGECGGSEGRRLGNIGVMETGAGADPCRLHLLSRLLQDLLSWRSGRKRGKRFTVEPFSKDDTPKRGHLSNKDTFSFPKNSFLQARNKFDTLPSHWTLD